MRFQHTIVFTSRRDLLERAIESIRPIWRYTSIIDNSPAGGLSKTAKWPVPVIRPSVPLSCAQSMNFQQRLAVERGADAWGYQHSDVEAPEGVAQKFYDATAEAVASGKRWAALFTSYDLLSSYSTSAVKELGGWDWHFPDPNYAIDIDFFHRARLASFEIIKSGLKVEHLDGGSTTRKVAGKSNARASAGSNEKYYRRKWGGPHKEETFARPWNWRPVKVFGLQRTGTNLATWLIEQNFHAEILKELAPDHSGWKHGRLEVGEWTQYAHFVVCTKHPLAWLASCYDYFTRDHGMDTTICPHFKPSMSFDEFCTSPHYTWPNPIARWNDMYAAWLADLPPERTVIVRAEDNLADQQKFMHAFCRMGNGGKTDPRVTTKDQVDVDGGIRGKVRREYYDQRQYIQRFSPILLAAITPSPELLSRFGYAI